MRADENTMPEDLQRLMEDWAQEVLIVTHRPRNNSLSISGQQFWDHVGSRIHGQLARASDVSVMLVTFQFVFNQPFGQKYYYWNSVYKGNAVKVLSMPTVVK